MIEIGSKTAEKNSAQTNRQTDRQMNRHYENNGHLAVNQKRSQCHLLYHNKNDSHYMLKSNEKLTFNIPHYLTHHTVIS